MQAYVDALVELVVLLSSLTLFVIICIVVRALFLHTGESIFRLMLRQSSRRRRTLY